MLWTSQTVLCVTLVVAMAATSLCTHAVPHPPHNTPAPSSHCPTDIIFVLDESSGVGATNFAVLKSFLSQFVAKLDVDTGNTRVGLLTYSTSVGTSIYLNAHSSVVSLQSAISSLSYSAGQYVNTAAALAYVRTTMLKSSTGARSTAHNVVVLITVGTSTHLTDTQTEADKLKSTTVGDARTKIVVIGVGSGVSVQELNYIVSEPRDTNFIHISLPYYIKLYAVEEQLKNASCSVEDPNTCTEYKLVTMKQRWQYLLASMTASQKLDLYVAILNDIAKYSSSLALKLKKEFLKEAHNSLTGAAELFFDSWSTIIYLYPDEEQLKAQIQYDAAARTDLARVFYGDAPTIAKSLLSVFSESLLTSSETTIWTVCLSSLAETVQRIAYLVKISAICHVDKDSGIPEFPITGNIVFTQPLYGGLTTISVSLCGFNDTYYRGWHVHEIGSTDNACAAAGPHFNPANLQHGGQDDEYRHVGDLGNFQADAKGRIILSVTDRLVSLQGSNSVLNRAVVIHRDQDDMGLGPAPGSLTTGNAGPRIACCVINSCISAYYH